MKVEHREWTIDSHPKKSAIIGMPGARSSGDRGRTKIKGRSSTFQTSGILIRKRPHVSVRSNGRVLGSTRIFEWPIWEHLCSDGIRTG